MAIYTRIIPCECWKGYGNTWAVSMKVLRYRYIEKIDLVTFFSFNKKNVKKLHEQFLL